jgi:hypothetical protein
LTVNPVNDPPVAGDVDLQDVHQDTPLTIYASELLANSYDVDSGDTISITSLTLSNPAAGTLVDNGDGTWTFTPASGFVGDDVAFSFTVSDNHGATDTGTALVDVVDGPNHPPVVNPVYLGTMNEDGSLTFTTASLLGNSSDLDGDALSVTSVSVDPFYGVVTDNGNGTWTFTPKADYYGNNVGMTFTVSDGNGGIGSSVAVVDVLSVNDAPVTSNVDLGAMNEDGGSLTITMAQLLANAYDVDGDVLTASGLTLSDPAAGTLVDNGDGTWTFTPAQDWNGNLSINYQVSDGDLSTLGTASLSVTPVNDPPVVGDVDLGQVHQAQSMIISAEALLAASSDVDGDPLNVTQVRLVDPAAGTLTDNGDGTWTFTPASGFVGDDVNFAFMVSDGNGGTALGTALVDVVAGPNHPPVVSPVDLGSMNEDGSITITSVQLLSGASDADGDTLTVQT